MQRTAWLLLHQVWVGGMATIGGDHETKQVAVAAARMLAELPSLQEPQHSALWGQLLEGALKLLEGREGASGGSEEEVIDIEEFSGERREVCITVGAETRGECFAVCAVSYLDIAVWTGLSNFSWQLLLLALGARW